ncbi:MAG: sugar ABC transporter substrate-binding protein [Clostridiales bacterium]|nr:sugar ABC transporter substrate-binding protein [Clostridiales bacterium]
MKKLIVILLAFVLILSLSACAQTPGAAPSDAAAAETPQSDAVSKPESDSPLAGKRIGCTIVYKGDEWCSALATALEKTAENYGATITVEDGEINDEVQTKQIENMLSSGVDMIFADPATPDGCTEVLMKAVDAGIPIIIYDCYWNEADQAVTSITWDQELTGELTAEYLIDYVAAHPERYPDGEANVVLLELNTSSAAELRSKCFTEVLAEKAPGIQIVEVQDCEGNREKGANVIANTVVPFDFVVSVVDNGAWGAVSTLRALGNEDVKVLSMGAYGAEPFEALYEDDPNYLACVVVDPQVISDGIYSAAERHLKGECVDATTYIDLFVADHSNVTNFWSFDE